MSTTSNTLTSGCSCETVLGPDPLLDRLRDLVGAGWDQWTASRALFGGEPLPPRTAADVPGWVRALTARRFGWWRESGRASDSLLIALACLLGVVAVVAGGLR